MCLQVVMNITTIHKIEYAWRELLIDSLLVSAYKFLLSIIYIK
jgi:hypothetical protein